MKFVAIPLVYLSVALVLSADYRATRVEAKKSSGQPRAGGNSGGSSSRRRPPPTDDPSGSRPTVSQRRKPGYEEPEEDDMDDTFEDFGYDDSAASSAIDDEVNDDDAEMLDEEEEVEDYVPPPTKSKKSSSASRRPGPSGRPSREGPPPRSSAARSTGTRRPEPQSRGPPRPRYEDEEDDYRPRPRPRSSFSGGPPKKQIPPSRTGRPGPSGGPPPGGRRPGGSVVPYSRHQQPSAFTRGLEAIRNSIPDPNTIREVAANSLNAAKATTSSLSANIYREIKGLTSSELEQVLLKATRPDDSAVKGKHVERLVGVTYQISAKYDIYDAVLRKLWAKMAEKDWRTKVKALYILHRFSADGAPEHAPALKARLRELRRTRDPKRKDKYFNSKQLLAGESKPETIKFRAFMSRYAHYVILRAQCFGGMFDEISAEPKVDKKKTPKPITNTVLRAEHLEAAAMLLKAGLACQLKDGEECENTAIAAERVASDMIGLTAAVAIALNRVLKDEGLKGGDPALIKKWCLLYKDQLLPQTKGMVKKMSSKLDAYGLFLPSRMGTSVDPDLLERGLGLEEEEGVSVSADDDKAGINEAKEEAKAGAGEKKTEAEEEEEEDKAPSPTGKSPRKTEEPKPAQEEMAEGDVGDEDEYEYEEEEYYDDEDE